MERSMENKQSIGGAMTALVTPFHNGEVDWNTLDRLIGRQVAEGTDWLVALGTTGETPTLSADEKEKIVARVMGKASDRCGIMVGTGSNNTTEAVRQTRWACSIGADAAARRDTQL